MPTIRELINVLINYPPEDVIAYNIWSCDDVFQITPKPKMEKIVAMRLLNRVQDEHDPEIGITWEFITSELVNMLNDEKANCLVSIADEDDLTHFVSVNTHISHEPADSDRKPIDRAFKAINASTPIGENLDTRIQALVADLKHLSDHYGLNWINLLDRAQDTYNDERSRH